MQKLAGKFILTLSLLVLLISADFCTNEPLPGPAKRMADASSTVFIEFGQLARRNKPLNLGQGFPDFAAPQYLIDQLHDVTNQSNPANWLNNQYARSYGQPRLTNVLVKYYNKFRSFDQLVDPNDQVLVTVGASEALYCAIMGFVNPGDEVIIIEPAYDAYVAMVRLAQGKPVFVPLRSSDTKNNGTKLNSRDFRLDMRELAQKVGPKTRMLILNTPNNPMGKVFSLEELKEIAKLCLDHNIMVLADEVYEHFYLDGRQHLSIAHLPGMWNRTITVGSAGKTFSVTGWKIGWALGPSHLMRYVQLVHDAVISSVARPLQEAVARAFEHEIDLLESNKSLGYWQELRSELKQKRDKMAEILEGAQMRPIMPEGGYFMLVDFSLLAKRYPEYRIEGETNSTGGSNSNDFRFARWLSGEKKLQAIPASAFYYDNKSEASNLLRFCFIKQTATLLELERLVAGFRGEP